LNEHRDYYAKSADSLGSLLSKHAFSEWFDGFFGPRTNAKLFATVGLLTGGGNYGVSAKLPDGSLEVSPVIGAYVFDKEGLPLFQFQQAFTLVHEFAHTYTNPLVIKHFSEFAQAAKALADANADQFRSQAYSGGQTVACETMVRVVTSIFARENFGETVGKQAVLSEINSGFWWTDGLVELFAEYKDRKKYPTLEAFLPQVVAYFKGVPARLTELKDRMPQVVSASPADGAKEIDAGTGEIRVTYSRPVRLVRAKGVYWQSRPPLETGLVSILEDGKTAVFSVKLEPGKTYRFTLHAAATAEGYAPIPKVLTFATKP
jgi:hypothetical protein